MGILHLVGNDTSYVVLSLFLCEIRLICISPPFAVAAILNLSQKTDLPWVDFGGLFYLDILYPKEHISIGMGLITFFSNLSVS